MPHSDLIENAKKESLAAKLAAAKLAAVAPPPAADEGSDWPPTRGMSEEEILTELEIAMYLKGMKVSLSLTNDSQGIWARGSVPKWSPDVYKRGKVCFTAAGSVAAALEKLVVSLEVDSEKVWKPDQFAR